MARRRRSSVGTSRQLGQTREDRRLISQRKTQFHTEFRRPWCGSELRVTSDLLRTGTRVGHDVVTPPVHVLATKREPTSNLSHIGAFDYLHSDVHTTSRHTLPHWYACLGYSMLHKETPKLFRLQRRGRMRYLRIMNTKRRQGSWDVLEVRSVGFKSQPEVPIHDASETCIPAHLTQDLRADKDGAR